MMINADVTTFISEALVFMKNNLYLLVFKRTKQLRIVEEDATTQTTLLWNFDKTI